VKKPLSLARYGEADLARALADSGPGLRWAAFEELIRRGEKRGWDAYGLLTRDPVLAALFASPKNPFEAVGVVVGPALLARARAAWATDTDDDGAPVFKIQFRHRRLDVMSLGPARGLEGDLPAREGLGEVSFRIKDVDAFVRRVDAPVPETRGRFFLVPQGPGPESRWLLVHAPGTRGVRTVLVRLIPA
jgi:hypothetical protein